MEREFIDLFKPQPVTPSQKKSTEPRPRANVIKHHEFKLGEKSRSICEPEKVKPAMKLNKDGEVVQQIEIQCKCGEKVLIDLEY